MLNDHQSEAARQGFDVDVDGLRFAVDLLAASRGAGRRPSDGSLKALPFPDLLPEDGIGERAALGALAGPILSDAARLGDPGFLAHMDPPTPWVSWAAAMWGARLNQNLLHPDTSPAARPLERLVVDWLSPFFGMDGGHLVPGSSVANLTALWVARDLRGVREVVCSEMAHLSIRKAAKILGLDFRTVPADELHRMDTAALGDISRSAVVVTAGTVAAGALDPLAGVAGARWLHVDAAWGGPLRLSASHSHLLDGVETADSVSVSAHKWLFQPKESAMILFRDSAAAHEAVSFGGGYLSVPNVGVLGSHGSSALPLVATLLTWGRRGVAQRIDHCMSMAQELTERIAAEPGLELHSRHQTGVVLWRPRGADSRAIRDRLRRSFVSLSEVRGTLWLRSVAANPMASPNDVVDDVLEAIG
ncbi:pyridoxal-dependent decarboxylase family protein, putative [Alloactinosynnema sp. L-07]|uniref:pyridoxal phosphate-dependent decarboxylase family protein n=1 Tax=Alloactinosynnema sp. L-07 TaxID=1653480 RepID=UPI00065EF2DE|nr:pyridoxal-dependent decarboxylase [Alloactinosynnema sp. L-07]CRK57863.1 pyridoxal-dependent decarboxylase family protein, putative [Alloactinosynnema sp. L-07]